MFENPQITRQLAGDRVGRRHRAAAARRMGAPVRGRGRKLHMARVFGLGRRRPARPVTEPVTGITGPAAA